MQVVEIIAESEGLTLRQRWAHVFTILVAIVLLLLGLNFRNRVVNAVSFYESPAAGISAFYPQNWLLDTNGDYVFRVRDMSRMGFKTTFQVSVRPVGADATERNIADRLSLDRFPVLTDYGILADDVYVLPDSTPARALSYRYTNSEVGPFLQGVPNVVVGFDVLTISGGQAIIITYRADSTVFEEEFPRFETFVRRLQF